MISIYLNFTPHRGCHIPECDYLPRDFLGSRSLAVSYNEEVPIPRQGPDLVPDADNTGMSMRLNKGVVCMQ